MVEKYCKGVEHEGCPVRIQQSRKVISHDFHGVIFNS